MMSQNVEGVVVRKEPLNSHSRESTKFEADSFVQGLNEQHGTIGRTEKAIDVVVGAYDRASCSGDLRYGCTAVGRDYRGYLPELNDCRSD